MKVPTDMHFKNRCMRDQMATIASLMMRQTLIVTVIMILTVITGTIMVPGSGGRGVEAVLLQN